jgi:ribosomal-protein-alanine N-acetyltransferase
VLLLPLAAFHPIISASTEGGRRSAAEIEVDLDHPLNLIRFAPAEGRSVMQTPAIPIVTERLIIRCWRGEDRAPFAAMCADPRVMEFLPRILDRAESDAKIDSHIANQEADGFCFWALEDRATGSFAGYTGLRRVDYHAHFTPAVEIGWRLPMPFWGKGLASEAAKACLTYGFEGLGLPEIVAITAPGNARSRSVMDRIGMTRDPADDFIHPALPPDHRLQPCMLYRSHSPAAAFQMRAVSLSLEKDLQP